MQRSVALLLHDVRSAENVGSIFRTADAIGAVSCIYLTGYTPAPIDRFGRPRQALAKSALGAELSLKWEEREDIVGCIDELRGNGYTVVAVEQEKRALDYKSYCPQERTALVFGNETEGLPKEIADAADAIIQLPMRGKKESLNVSVAAGIVLYRLFDR